MEFCSRGNKGAKPVLWSKARPRICESTEQNGAFQALGGTFISRVPQQIISRTWTFLAALVGDGKEWTRGDRLGPAAVAAAAAASLCPTGRLRINAAGAAAAALHQGRWSAMAIRNILRLRSKEKHILSAWPQDTLSAQEFLCMFIWLL